MDRKDFLLILEEIREIANHWYEDYCHDKCHEVMDYCTAKIKEIKEVK